MSLHTLLLAAAPALAVAPPAELFAIRVGRAETIAKGTIEHAVILVEDGKIAAIGEDLPVERGIRVLERPDWVVMPGLVNAYSRMGLDGEAGDDQNADVRASKELYPNAEEYKELLEYGVTTLGLYPAGNGIPGQAVAVRPNGSTREAMVLADPAYLKVILRATPASKKMLEEAFDKADEYVEKEKKAREKWDKEQEKKKKPAAKPDEKKEEKKTEEKKEDAKQAEDKKEEAKPEAKDAKEGEKYVPPEPDAKVKPFLDLRKGTLRGLFSISSAAEYLHLLDALGEEKFAFDLRIPAGRELDIFYVTEKKTYDLEVDGIGDRKCRVVIEPVITLLPGTMRQRNPAAELARAGAKIVLIPRNDSLPDHKQWLTNVGEVVTAGLKREVALRAMTLEPAELLGVQERLGSLEKGKDANMIFLDGDPFEPATRIKAVMLEGEIVFGEVKL